MLYKLMTFNIRIDVISDGKFKFTKRLPSIIEKLNELELDIICFQEITRKMLKKLLPTLSRYSYVGEYRDTSIFGEANFIFFRKDKFQLIETQTMWLSETPQVKESRFKLDQSILPRIITTAKLETVDHKIINIFNTHFDHEGPKSRLLSSHLISNYVNINQPVILTGDFNSNPEDEPILEISKLLTDITSHLPYTFHQYYSGKVFTKIDYIFVNEMIDYQNVKIVESNTQGMHLSDHHPIYMEFKL